LQRACDAVFIFILVQDILNSGCSAAVGLATQPTEKNTSAAEGLLFLNVDERLMKEFLTGGWIEGKNFEQSYSIEHCRLGAVHKVRHPNFGQF